MPKPQDVTNTERAELAGAAAQAYANEGGYFDPNPAELLGDLLGDLRHWAKAMDVDFDQCAKNARACFEEEVKEEEEEKEEEKPANTYLLNWEIEWDAATPRDAAQEVIRQFFGNVGLADHFSVTDLKTGKVVTVNAFSDQDEGASHV
jgi:hypothetical protein